MGWLVKILVVLTLLWCGLWWFASTLIERGVAGWLSDMRAQGWQVEVDSIAVDGFPFSFKTTLGALTLSDPKTGRGTQAKDIRLSAPVYWPGDITLSLPQTPIALSGANGLSLFMRAREGEITLRLHPKMALGLREFNATSGPWQINMVSGNLASGKSFDVEFKQDSTQAYSYGFSINADELVPGDTLRAMFDLPAEWPSAFEVFTGEGDITFDQPLDRFALENRPLPSVVAFRRLDAIWGSLRVSGQGHLSISTNGIPEGDLSLSIDNWQQALEFAGKGGLLKSDQRKQIGLVLGALANRGDNPDNLELRLLFKDGAMLLSGIPLGPAPRLFVR